MMEEKPKIIGGKLKDKKLMIFGHFFKQKKKKKKEKKKHKERIIKNKIIRDIIEQEKNCYELKRKSNFLHWIWG